MFRSPRVVTDGDLDRFVAAQAEVWPAPLAELRRGAKTGHWMWFVFPQLAGLGHSAMARHYALASLAEARAYLAHPVLGARLGECVAALGPVAGPAEAVLGAVDALKLRSSLTLFVAAGAGAGFAALLDRWFAGPDSRTTALLSQITE